MEWDGWGVGELGLEMLSFWSRGFRVEDVTVCACETDVRWRNFTVPAEVWGFAPCDSWLGRCQAGQALISRVDHPLVPWGSFGRTIAASFPWPISFRVRMWFASVQPSVHVKQQLNGSMP